MDPAMPGSRSGLGSHTESGGGEGQGRAGQSGGTGGASAGGAHEEELMRAGLCAGEPGQPGH